MRTLFVALSLILITASQTCAAKESRFSSYTKDMAADLLTAVSPEEFASYTKLSKIGPDDAFAYAALTLLTSNRQRFANNLKKAPNDRLPEDSIAYSASWELAIRAWRKVKDPVARTIILDAWNRSLTDEETTTEQLRALYDEWEPGFLTEHYWKLLRETDRRDVVYAFCAPLGQHGELGEEAKLGEKLKTTTDRHMRAMIEEAIEKIGYWKKGDTNRIGPPNPVRRK